MFKPVLPEFAVDFQHSIWYLKLSSEPVVRTEEYKGLVLDLDREGRVVGIEGFETNNLPPSPTLHLDSRSSVLCPGCGCSHSDPYCPLCGV